MELNGGQIGTKTSCTPITSGFPSEYYTKNATYSAVNNAV